LREAHRRFPVSWPRSYLALAADEVVARMGRPAREELAPHPGDIPDPIADRAQRPVPFIVRKHEDRVIVLAAKRCHFYCRFCFRREEPVRKSSEPGSDDWERIYRFLHDHPEIQEPILSGGDPLTLDDTTLGEIGRRFSRIPSVRRWRIHTRAPVHFPQRLTIPLMEQLAQGPPLHVVTHYNNVAEITAESIRIAKMMAMFDVKYENQAVLLRGVNDSAKAQSELWNTLAETGIGARYLHHPDRVAGNASFRVTIRDGLSIYDAMRAGLDVPAPEYVLDLPDGRGKVPVRSLERTAPRQYRFQHADGAVSHYEDFA
jgi:lysine 2,3-aminomutase